MFHFIRLFILISLSCLSFASKSTNEEPVSIVTMPPNEVMADGSELEQETGLQIKSICDAENPVAVIEKTDECIADPVMKESIMKCRIIAYGSDQAVEASTKFCSASVDARSEMDDIFDACLSNQGINQEAIQVEFVANCGFCQNIQLINKTEECFSDGVVKKDWVECREQVYGTRDPLTAAEKYCQGNKLERLNNDRLFDECLMTKNVTQASFEAALTNC